MNAMRPALIKCRPDRRNPKMNSYQKQPAPLALAFALLCALVAPQAMGARASLLSQAAAQGPGAIALPTGVERVTSVEGITEYRLQNGLRVLLFPDPSKPKVTVSITYLVGSKHEKYGETGMAPRS